MGRVAETRTAHSVEQLAERLGAATATETDQARYLHWVLDQHRYQRTAGMVRNTMVQVPLRDVFVDLAAERDHRPGDRVEVWLKRERTRLQVLRDSGELDGLSFEAELDRLLVQAGAEAGRVGESSEPTPVSVLTAVRDCRQLLVLGDPGSGKTTLLRYLAFRHATARVNGSGAVDGELGRPRFPIYVRLGDFARSPDRAGGIGAFLAGYVKGQECAPFGVRARRFPDPVAPNPVIRPTR
jgi:hypothetical protein